MNHLVVIVGGMGAVKSFLLSKIVDINKAFNDGSDSSRPISQYPYCVVKKYTTRSPRANETSGATDLYFNASAADLEKCGKFVYTYGSNIYGIDCEEIDRKLANDQSPMVIVRDFRIVESLKKRYNCVVDIYCKCGLSKDDLKDVLKNNGAADDEIIAGMNNIENDDNQWQYSDCKFYDYIVNRYDGTFMSAIISSLQRAPKWNLRQITIIALGANRLNNIERWVQAANKGNTPFVIETIDAVSIDLNDLNAKENIIIAIKQSRLTIIDISFDYSFEDSIGLYSLADIVFNSKHGSDKLIIADNSISQSIPFDIIKDRVYFYDNHSALPEIIQKRIQSIFEFNS